jgi:hypothetical protein
MCQGGVNHNVDTSALGLTEDENPRFPDEKVGVLPQWGGPWPPSARVCAYTYAATPPWEAEGMGPVQLGGPQAQHSRSAGSRGTRVGSVNTSAVMSILTLAMMSIHSAQSANFVQIIGIPSPGLGTLR